MNIKLSGNEIKLDFWDLHNERDRLFQIMDSICLFIFIKGPPGQYGRDWHGISPINCIRVSGANKYSLKN